MRRLLAFLLFINAAPLHADIDVAVEGVDGALRDNALAFLGVQQYREREDLTETIVRRLHARAPEEIRKALQPFGYYRVDVEAHLARVGDDWRARYVVDRGSPTRIETLEVRIAGDAAAFADLLASPPLNEGEILRHAQYEDYKTALLNRARQRGYLDARFTTQRMAVNTDTLTAHIELVLETGHRYYFGDIHIEQDILDDDFVRRYLAFQPGDPLSYAQLLELQYALTDSDYFAVVDVQARREQAENFRVPVTVAAQAQERSKYTVGLGYGTDTGPRISLGFQRRYVNRRGHRLSVETTFSEIQNSFATRYTIPLADPTRESFQLFAGTINEELGDVESQRITLGASFVNAFDEWEQTLYLRAEREDSLLPDTEFRTESLIPGISWLVTRADDLFYTRDGYKLFADLRGSHGALGSNTEFLRLHLLGKYIFPLDDRWRVLLRASAGAVLLADTSQLPVSQRFFAGGDQSVRGFDYNRLAPTDAEGRVLGGRYMATGSAEIEYRFAEDWAVAAFTDAGNAVNALEDFETKTSYGLGLRWISPVGMVRVDLARPTDSDLRPENGVELHISLGPDL